MVQDLARMPIVIPSSRRKVLHLIRPVQPRGPEKMMGHYPCGLCPGFYRRHGTGYHNVAGEALGDKGFWDEKFAGLEGTGRRSRSSGRLVFRDTSDSFANEQMPT